MSYDRLAKHIGHKELASRERAPPVHVKGWRLLSKAQWLRRGTATICFAGATAADFIQLCNDSAKHPLFEIFNKDDAPRLAHLLNSGWVWSNSVKVNHMHGWEVLAEPPPRPETLLSKLPTTSPYSTGAPTGGATANMPSDFVSQGANTGE